METARTWHVELQLVDHESSTAADAVLTTQSGTTLKGHGHARRNPSDEDVPEIGEELAASRALRDLADRLLQAASGDITRLEHHEVHLLR